MATRQLGIQAAGSRNDRPAKLAARLRYAPTVTQPGQETKPDQSGARSLLRMPMYVA